MIKLLDILENKVLIPRRSKEERQKNHVIAVQKQIQQYMQQGSVGDLDLDHAPITSLPDNLVVGGYLKLRKVPIVELPKNLEVKRGLFAIGSKIKTLPDNLQVGEELYLTRTLVDSIPRNLRVGGNLHIESTPLAKKYTQEELKDMLPGVKGLIQV